MENLKTLLQKRSCIKGRITTFSKYLETIKLIETQNLSKVLISELEFKLSRFKEVLVQFDDLKNEIEILDSTQLEENEKIEDEFCSYISRAQNIIDNFNDLNKDSNSSYHNSASCTTYSNIKLPTIQLPSFDGNHLKWMEFRDTFDSLINNNSSIPEINKFHYLRSSLEKGASNVIKSIEFTAVNYKTAWNLLLDRYNNNRILINNHLKALFNFEPINKESFKSLRFMIDYFSKNLRALNALNEPTAQWDTLIVYMMVSKLDGATSRKWEEHRSNISSSPTIEEFYDFLRNRADVLETLQYGKNDSNKSEKQNSSFVKENKSTKSFVSASDSNQNSCVICSQDHLVYKCDKFKSMSVEARYSEVSKHKLCHNCLRPGHFSSVCKHSSCKICNKKHNLLLHKQFTNTNITHLPAGAPPTTSSVSADGAAAHQTSTLTTQTPRVESCDDILPAPVSLSTSSPGQVLLCTAELDLVDTKSNKTCRVRALLDNGSQSSFMTEKLLKKMNLSYTDTTMIVAGLSNKVTTATKTCDVILKSRINSFQFDVSCYVIPEITGILPSVEVDTTKLNIPKSLELADPSFCHPSEIDVLLGADVYWELLDSQQINLGKNRPTLQKSKLGWIVSGPTGQTRISTTRSHFCQEIKDTIAKFWELEDIPMLSIKEKLSKDEDYCENHFLKNTTRLENGRFSVKIPFREAPEVVLGDSHRIAKKRFYNLEKKLSIDVKTDYTKFIEEYEQLGHLTNIGRANNVINTLEFGYYIPHHAVIRTNSETTRLRVVFDASCKTTTKKSLNDIQFVGPVVQNDLMTILLRFRQYAYVVTADVEKMYRQVMVDESQRHLQLILWRKNENEPLDVLQLNTLTYGTASAPYLSTRCLVQLASECTDETVANTIKNDFYVDDLSTGSNSKSNLKSTIKGVVTKLSEGCFPLRKFRTNSPDIFDGISTVNESQEFSKESSVLGLKWSPKYDTLHYSVADENITKITKRSILSNSCKIFDPLGLLSACTIFYKITLQKLWLCKHDWDESLPNDISNSWLEFYKESKFFEDINVPRYTLCDSPTSIEAHCFTDASQDAYGACIYLKSENENNEKSVNLLCAKARVSPLKTETVPRLELLGALLGAKLYAMVVRSLKVTLSRSVFWTDSTIVLGWLHTESKTLKTYVSNRVEQIKELTDKNAWRHVPTALNPADMASRGIRPRLLIGNELWWHGPPFLFKSENEWPVTKCAPESLPETKVNLTTKDLPNYEIPFDKYSKLYKLQRIFAYVLRFINNTKNKTNKINGELTYSELYNSLTLLAKASQRESYQKEINLLENNKNLDRKSSLLSLNPFLDEQGVLRVGGRLDLASQCPYEKRHPILLHPKHRFSRLLFEYEHCRLLHCGPQQLLNSIRQRFWPTGGKALATTIVRKCIRCQRFTAKPSPPIMGNLPQPRVTPASPFETCGTDFAGPFTILNRKGRGAKTSKCYLCIFVCFCTKAVHLEVVSDLSTNAFILCLRRFISRRGKPNTIYSDNGKNFVGANNELNKLLKAEKRAVNEFACSEGITFKFSPAYAPHFGGIWEAGVKTAKFHLKRIAGNSSLTFEELYTLFAQIEAIMNSRPLTCMSSDPSDLLPLTPGHFLVGRPLTSLPSPVTERISLTRYELIERLRQHFWNRWTKDYLTSLQQRLKWKTNGRGIVVGDLVLIMEDHQPPMRWLLGRVHQLYPGDDGVCRVVAIKTTNGIIKRAVTKICALEGILLESDIGVRFP